MTDLERFNQIETAINGISSYPASAAVQSYHQLSADILALENQRLALAALIIDLSDRKDKVEDRMIEVVSQETESRSITAKLMNAPVVKYTTPRAVNTEAHRRLAEIADYASTAELLRKAEHKQEEACHLLEHLKRLFSLELIRLQPGGPR